MAKYSLLVWETKPITEAYLLRNRGLDERQRRIIRAAHGSFINGFHTPSKGMALQRLKIYVERDWKEFRILISDYKECPYFAEAFDALFKKYFITKVWISGVVLTRDEAWEKRKQKEDERKELAKQEGNLKLLNKMRMRMLLQRYVAELSGVGEMEEEGDD